MRLNAPIKQAINLYLFNQLSLKLHIKRIYKTTSRLIHLINSKLTFSESHTELLKIGTLSHSCCV